MFTTDKGTLVKALLLLVTVLVGVIVWMQVEAQRSPTETDGTISVGGKSGSRSGNSTRPGSSGGSNSHKAPRRPVVPFANPIDSVTDWVHLNGTRGSDEQLLAAAMTCVAERPAAVVYLRVAGTGSGTLQAHTRRNAEATGRFTYAILGSAPSPSLTSKAGSKSGSSSGSDAESKSASDSKGAELRALLSRPPHRVVAETDGAYVRLLPDAAHGSRNGTGAVAYVTLLREPLARAMALHRAACPTFVAAKTDSKADSKTDSKADSKSDSKADSKSDAKSDSTADAKSDSKAAAAAAKLKALCEKSFASFVSKAQPNPITRQMCGSQPQCRSSAADALYIAKVRLVYTFSVVGIAERFQDSIKMLHAILPHFFSKSYDGSKISDDFTTAAISSLSVSDRNKFYQLHRYDAQLYSFARRLFEVKAQGCMSQATSINGKVAHQPKKLTLSKN
eukprot:TRINITY_DN1589_c0_g1_i4.p1 TRINITY_DN1589_c0_g1~~TRINITY_DN1589_c0_g1_i4.p1  ORF type:complete len:449 (+),score=67.99 TRINITY_DN1589_c0_g1_i4:104-1450(+)